MIFLFQWINPWRFLLSRSEVLPRQNDLRSQRQSSSQILPLPLNHLNHLNLLLLHPLNLPLMSSPSNNQATICFRTTMFRMSDLSLLSQHFLPSTSVIAYLPNPLKDPFHFGVYIERGFHSREAISDTVEDPFSERFTVVSTHFNVDYLFVDR